MASKHMIIVIAVIVILAGSLVLAFVFFTPDPEKITLESIDKQLKINKYTTSYNLSYSTKTGGLSLNANGDITIVKNGDLTKVSLALDTFGEKIRIDQYQTDNGVIQCMRSLLNTTCQKVPQSSVSLKTPQEQSQALKDLISRKVLELSYTGAKTIAGRGCDGVNSVYDPKKDNALSQVSGNLQMSLCLDRETGIPLEMIMNIDLGSGQDGGSLSIDMVLMSMSLDAQEIMIPEYTEVSDIGALSSQMV